MAINGYERAYQIYSWYKTARLNVLYYEESLRRWSLAVKIHDSIIAVTSASSPIAAFVTHSPNPVYQQGWFYLTLIAAVLATFKPILGWDKEVKLFTELHAQYCDIYMDMKYLCEDIAAAGDISSKANTMFELHRRRFKDLEKKEPTSTNKKKIKRLEDVVNREIDINNCWFPAEEEVTYGR